MVQWVWFDYDRHKHGDLETNERNSEKECQRFNWRTHTQIYELHRLTQFEKKNRRSIDVFSCAKPRQKVWWELEWNWKLSLCCWTNAIILPVIIQFQQTEGSSSARTLKWWDGEGKVLIFPTSAKTTKSCKIKFSQSEKQSKFCSVLKTNFFSQQPEETDQDRDGGSRSQQLLYGVQGQPCQCAGGQLQVKTVDRGEDHEGAGGDRPGLDPDAEGPGLHPQLPVHPGPDIPLLAHPLPPDDKESEHELGREALAKIPPGKLSTVAPSNRPHWIFYEANNVWREMNSISDLFVKRQCFIVEIGETAEFYLPRGNREIEMLA